MTIEIILICVGVILSFFFSGFETGFISTNKIRIRHLASENDRRAKKLLKLTNDSDKVIATMLIGNNLALVMVVVVFNIILEKLFPNYDAVYYSFLSTAILTPTLLIVGEVIPKSIFYRYATTLSLYFAGLIKFLYYPFSPFVLIVVSISNVFSRCLKIEHEKNKNLHSIEEFKSIFQIGTKEGIVKHSDRILMDSVLTFKKTRAREIMTPLVDIVSIEINTPREEVIDVINKHKYSRIPVYKERVDNVIAYISSMEYIWGDADRDMETYLKESYFIPETKSISNLLFEMRSKKYPIVFVVDEYGGTSGVITTRNLAEEVVGEILEGKDEAEVEVVEGNKILEVAGETDVDDLNREYDLNIEKDGFETLAGFACYILGRIPKVNEKFEYLSNRYTIISADEKSVQRIRIEKLEDNENIN